VTRVTLAIPTTAVGGVEGPPEERAQFMAGEPEPVRKAVREEEVVMA